MIVEKKIMNDLLKNLNPAQREAVKATEGPVLIIAGAGSGKTRTLTHRVAYLIKEKKINPLNILAVTFTNKAAQEMKERITELLSDTNQPSPFGKGRVGEGFEKREKKESVQNNDSYQIPPNPPFPKREIRLPTVGTFHSVCARILRREIDKLGYKKSFNIFDSQDQLALVKKIFKDLSINKDQFNPASFLTAISEAKNKFIGEDVFSRQAEGFYEETVAKVYNAYQKELKKNNILDFDDLIRLTVKIFQEFSEVLAKYQNLFRYILVDEYQDTNHAQYLLVKLLSQKHRNLCVVGDDWQCLPPGTKIEKGKTKANIENISAGDNVFSCAGGLNNCCAQKVEVTKKFPFNGNLIELKTKRGNKLLTTPNHILFSKLSVNFNIFYVYLMYKKEKGYRIGMAEGARIAKAKTTSIGLNVRANQERADKMWVLKVCETKTEAIFWEEYFSSYYGIPSMVFMVSGRNMKLEQKYLDKLYKNIDTLGRAKKLFSDLELDFNYPHHVPASTIKNNTKRITIHITMFNDNRKMPGGNWGLHQISLNSTDAKTKRLLEKHGFKTRKGKFNDWRMVMSKKNYSELEKILDKIKKVLPHAEIIKKASLTKSRKRFHFMPAAHIRKTMLVPVYKNGKIIEDEITSVKKVKYKGNVYDLNIANTHNYIANNFVVHNSIYGWRQADIKNILSFEKDYPGAKIVKLEQNYRSTQIILDAADGIISKNVNRKDKKVWTENKSGQPIAVYEARDETDEAEFIAEEIKSRINRKEEYRYSDFAVLYRTNAQSRIIEEVFLKESIPYRIIGGLKFYQRKEIKDMIAYLRLIQDGNDYVSLERIINEPRRGIGKKTLAKWAAFAKENDLNLLDASAKISPQNSELKESKIKAIRQFCDFIFKMRDFKDRAALANLIEKVFKDSGYENSLVKTGIENLSGKQEGETRIENVRELLSVAEKYKNGSAAMSLELFLEEVALASDTDDIEQKENSVHLMTLHSAKGLEFPIVFIAGLEEGILPHSRSMLNPDEMEEERRLMYVGITRAKEKVCLLYAGTRVFFGSTQANPPSRFLDDIPAHLIAHSVERKSQIAEHGTQNMEYEMEDAPRSTLHDTCFSDGQRVRHPDFGEGVVISTQDDIITIAFMKAGVKKLSATYAPLEKV